MTEIKELIDQKPCWLTTSYFCSKEQWSILLKEIKNFLENLEVNLLTYNIQISNQYGDNIRLSLLTRENEVDDLGQKILLRFEPLLSSFPKESFKFPIRDINLPFPTNTVEFGVYEIHFHELYSAIYKIQEELSKAMIEGLKEEKIESDTLLTFSLYLQVSLFKACSNLLPNFKKGFTVLIQDDLKPNSKLRQALNENHNLVLEITKDIMEEKSDEDLAWVETWYNVSSTLLKEEMKAYKGNSNSEFENFIKNFYQKSIYFINSHLGLSLEEIKISNNLLSHSLKELYQ